MNDKFTGMLGLATRAGCVVSGEFSVEQAIKKRKVFLVIVAQDASDNTKKHFSDMCSYRNIPIVFACSKLMLGKFTGKQARASAGVTNKGFADRLITIKREGLI